MSMETTSGIPLKGGGAGWVSEPAQRCQLLLGIAATELEVSPLLGALPGVDSVLFPHAVTVLSAMTAPAPSAASCVIVVILM